MLAQRPHVEAEGGKRAQGNQKEEQEQIKGSAGSKVRRHAPILGGWKSA